MSNILNFNFLFLFMSNKTYGIKEFLVFVIINPTLGCVISFQRF